MFNWVMSNWILLFLVLAAFFGVVFWLLGKLDGDNGAYSGDAAQDVLGGGGSATEPLAEDGESPPNAENLDAADVEVPRAEIDAASEYASAGATLDESADITQSPDYIENLDLATDTGEHAVVETPTRDAGVREHDPDYADLDVSEVDFDLGSTDDQPTDSVFDVTASGSEFVRGLEDSAASAKSSALDFDLTGGIDVPAGHVPDVGVASGPAEGLASPEIDASKIDVSELDFDIGGGGEQADGTGSEPTGGSAAGSSTEPDTAGQVPDASEVNFDEPYRSNESPFKNLDDATEDASDPEMRDDQIGSKSKND